MTALVEFLPEPWRAPLGAELAKPYVAKLEAFLAAERAAHQVFPPPQDVFRALARLRDQAVSAGLLDAGAGLSMGMSDDFEIAIEEGATIVRVGSALFGTRGAVREEAAG